MHIQMHVFSAPAMNTRVCQFPSVMSSPFSLSSHSIIFTVCDYHPIRCGNILSPRNISTYCGAGPGACSVRYLSIGTHCLRPTGT